MTQELPLCLPGGCRANPRAVLTALPCWRFGTASFLPRNQNQGQFYPNQPYTGPGDEIKPRFNVKALPCSVVLCQNSDFIYELQGPQHPAAPQGAAAWSKPRSTPCPGYSPGSGLVLREVRARILQKIWMGTNLPAPRHPALNTAPPARGRTSPPVPRQRTAEPPLSPSHKHPRPSLPSQTTHTREFGLGTQLFNLRQAFDNLSRPGF